MSKSKEAAIERARRIAIERGVWFHPNYTTKPPKIEAIKKALGCSQGKAHKLRTMAAVRLAKSSSSSTQREHEHFDAETGEIIEPKPEDGDDGITESREEGADLLAVAAEQPSVPSAPAEQSVNPCLSSEGESLATTPGKARDSANTSPGGPEVARVAPPVSPTVDESPATPSVGAVADDDLDIPAHLRGPSPANRRLGA